MEQQSERVRDNESDTAGPRILIKQGNQGWLGRLAAINGAPAPTDYDEANNQLMHTLVRVITLFPAYECLSSLSRVPILDANGQLQPGPGGQPRTNFSKEPLCFYCDFDREHGEINIMAPFNWRMIDRMHKTDQKTYLSFIESADEHMKEARLREARLVAPTREEARRIEQAANRQ